MTDSEVLSVPRDNGTNVLPREGQQRRTGELPKPPAIFKLRPVIDGEQPEGVWGGYPKGFVPEALKLLRVRPHEVLHVCSGALPKGSGVRVDLRAAARPDVRADGRQLPFRDETFPAVMIDPPYTVEYAKDLYGTEYPRPSHLLREASRVVKPGGRIGILHFLVPMSLPGIRLETVRGVTTGAGYRIRAFSVFQREHRRLL